MRESTVDFIGEGNSNQTGAYICDSAAAHVSHNDAAFTLLMHLNGDLGNAFYAEQDVPYWDAFKEAMEAERPLSSIITRSTYHLNALPVVIDCRGCGDDFTPADALTIYCDVCVGDKTKLAAHFTPGNVVFSDYWREYDLVIAFHPATSEGYWSVDVMKCDAHGTPVQGELVRDHCTQPSTRDKVISRKA